MRGLFWRYLLAQTKRTAKSFWRVLGVALAILIAIGAAVAAFAVAGGREERMQLVRIGLVGAADDEIMRIGFAVLEELDTARFSVEFEHFAEEEEAKALLANDTIDAYLLIPEGFSRAFLYGEEKQLTYVMRETGVSVGAALTKEVFAVLSNYVNMTRAGVVGMCDFAEALGVSQSVVSEHNLDMTVAYVQLVARRSALTAVEELKLDESLSDGGYYIVAMTVFFLLLFGVACCQLRIRRDGQLDRLLCGRGLGAFGRVTAEYIPYLLAAMLVLLIPAASAGAVSEFVNFSLPELKYRLFSGYIKLALGALPAVFSVTALQFLLYEVTGGTVSCVLAQFGAAVGLGYVSGCFYPSAFFPEAVQRVARVLPTGSAFAWIGGILTDTPPLSALCGCICWGVGLLAATAGVRYLRLQKEEGTV